ncbi:Copper resistance protein CopC [Nitrosococcus oceani ATCC 19707]|uniref:Copper resistance protein C n=2 Tax=Nitrosococcus oceani TaxID=1229 RepID=Q3JAD2_NITOC|nr:copper resistance CopC family protein [Nitrosococcus oceani]ABA58214.1 Copper resistance protein CopC [Nitrosococcus oceani ATCC 19707]KFI19327.1 copper resistance protein CopC [Nitrosococcus oceani C-27]
MIPKTAKMPSLMEGLSSGVRILLVLGITVTLAWEHAVVVKSSPADQALLTQAPDTITLCFNVKIEKAFSRVNLWSMEARLKMLPIADRNFTQDAEPACLHISLPPLKSGAYQVRYKILAADGHTMEGVVRFAINEPE